jgi:hypothetical protein
VISVIVAFPFDKLQQSLVTQFQFGIDALLGAVQFNQQAGDNRAEVSVKSRHLYIDIGRQGCGRGLVLGPGGFKVTLDAVYLGPPLLREVSSVDAFLFDSLCECE